MSNLGQKLIQSAKEAISIAKGEADPLTYKIHSTEKRYLVYKSWNGQVHTSIEYGEQHTGDGVKKDSSEIKRFEIKHKIDNIKFLKELYPVEN